MPYREVYILDGENTRWETIYEPDPPAAKQKPADVKPTATTTAAKTTTAPASSFVLGQSNLPEIETRYLDLGESIVPQYFVAGTNIQIDDPTYFEDYSKSPLTESSVPTFQQNNVTVYDKDKGGEYVYSPEGDYLGFQPGKRDSGIGGFIKEAITETAPIWAAALTGGAVGNSIGAAILPSANAATQALIGNAVLQGASSAAQGGDFLKGALTSAAGSALGGIVRPELVELTGSNALANSLTSGAISELSGGNFLQGAIQGGIAGATQDAKLALADKYLDAVEPGTGYNPATSPTELDVIQAFPELAPPSDNFSQGVTDILDYAANTPSVQLAAGPNYVGEFEGMPYDPNYTSDAGTGAYRVEVSGQPTQSGWSDFQWENQSPEEYLDSVEPGVEYNDLTSPTEQDVLVAFPELTPNVADAFPELFQNNQGLPIPTEVFIPQQTAQDVVNTISADVSVANPSLTADEVRSIVEGSISNLPPGLSAEDVRTIVTDSLTNLPAAPTQQDIINIIGGQNFATPDDIRTAISGIQFPAGMTPQDVQNIVSEAFQNNPGITATDVQDIVQGALNNLPPGLSSDDVRNIVTDAVSSIPSAPTEQDIINIISGQNFATPEDIQTAIAGINFPVGMTSDDVQNIVSDAFRQNPGITSTEVQDIVQGAINNLPQGLSSEDVRNIVTDAVSNIPAAPTEQDIINIIGGQGLATGQDLSNLADQLGLTQQELFNQIGNVQTGLESQLNQQGRDFMDYLQQQGFDYETALNEAIAAQQDQFGTALNQTTEDLLNEIAASGSGLQQEFETGLQGLADQLGITQQELIDQLNQASESFGTQVSGLQEQFTNLGTSNAQQFSDLIKTVGLLGTGLGALQSTFNSAQEASLPRQFEIVAPPSDWQSPTYNLPSAGQVPFTPSAPIDFGSPELLQGTQFARPAAQPFQMPYDLSNVVNTLNFQSVPFIQQPVAQSFTGIANQPTAGVNNIIGNLNGAPVSIADIISNIQGQYGQKAAS